MMNRLNKFLILLPAFCFFLTAYALANHNIDDLALNVKIQSLDVDCFGESTGRAKAIVDGGLPPYQFEWNNGVLNDDIDWVTAGVYSVTVTDDAGVSVSVDVTIAQPDMIQLEVTQIVAENCMQENGAIFVSVSGGTGDYDFKWANDSDDQNLTDVSDGEYSVVVTDENGCKQKFGPFEVPSDCDPLPCDGPTTTNISVNDSECDYGSGSIYLSIPNVNLPHTFEWSNGDDTEDVTGLEVGIYTVTVTDNQGCSSVFGPFDITCDEVPCLHRPTLVNVVVTDADCGQSNGAIDITIEGANPPFTYQWNVGGITTEDIDNLPPGNYGVLVTDAEGCNDKFGNIFVGEDCDPPMPCVAPVVASVVVIEATCENSDGQAFINLVGGNAGYSFDWSPSVSNESFAQGIEASTYSVIITNSNNPECTLTETFTVGNSNGPQPEILSTLPASCNQDNGVAVMSDLNLLYTWDNGSNSNNPTNLTAGEHQVTVVDPSTNCINVIEVVIPQVTILNASPNIIAQPSSGSANGEVTIDVFNGSLDYTYEWPDGDDSPSRDDLEAGLYSVTVTDLGATGCEVIVNFILTNDGSGIDITFSGDPSVNCIGDTNGSVDFNISPAGADVTVVIIDPATGVEYMNGNLPAGDYCMVATDNSTGDVVGGNCFTIHQPNQIDVDFATVPQSCDGLGSIEVVDIMGGNGGYIYDWANINPTTNDPQNQFDLSSGSYDIIVTDALGCSASANIPVADEGEPLEIGSVAVVNTACPNDTEGSITVEDPTNGTPPYVYTWNGSVGTNTISNLGTGPVLLEVTDANGCTTTQTFNIESMSSLDDLMIPTDTTVCAGMANLNASSASADLIQWFNENGELVGEGPNVDLPVGDAPQNITVIASNAGGCTDEQSFVLDGSGIMVEVNEVGLLCVGENNQIDVLDYDESAGYSFGWSPADLIASGMDTPTPTLNSDNPGDEILEVTVTNAEGCEQTFDVPASFISNEVIIGTMSATECQDLMVGFSVDEMYPGAMWDFGDNGASGIGNMVSHTYSEPGTYNVLLTFSPEIDCVEPIAYEVVVDDVPDNNINAGNDMQVCSDNPVALSVQGSANNSYEWYNIEDQSTLLGTGSEIQVPGQLPAPVGGLFDPATYLVIGTDANNCVSYDTISVTNFEISFDMMPIQTLCPEGDAGQLQTILPLEGVGPNAMFTWSSNVENLNIDATQDMENPMISASDVGNGSVTLNISNQACSFEDSIDISVFNFEPFALDATAENDTIVVGEMTEVEVVNGSPFDIIWPADFSDIDGNKGTYGTTVPGDRIETFVVTVIDPETGCEVQERIQITVLDPQCNSNAVFFPNLFTPNGDGMNDVLYLRGTFVDEVYFTIYDRWGEKVFESNALDHGWDGTYKGKVLSNDVYGYYLRVVCFNGQEYFRQGNVTLLR